MAKPAKKPEPPKSLLEIHHMEQGSPEWFEARRGLITASEFAVVLRDAEAKTRSKLIYKLAGERMSGEIAADDFKSASMARGNLWEPLAREAYAQARGFEVDQIGFATNFDRFKRCGASPDGLVGFDGGVEIKICSPVALGPLLERGSTLPPAYRAQVYGNLMVLERDWWDLFIWWPKMPKFLVRVYRDEAAINEISNGVERFNYDVEAQCLQWAKMGGGL